MPSSPRRLRRLFKPFSSAFILAIGAILAAPPSDAAVTSDSKAARGLDMFIHAPGAATTGASVPIHVVAYGFPAVTTMLPLADTSVEARWDPESLGPNQSSAPPPIRKSTDAQGRVQLDVPIPPGDDRELKLLIGLQVGEHSRVRVLTIHRTQPYKISLHVADSNVVPGSIVPVWANVSDVATGEPVPGIPVNIQLTEHGVVRKNIQMATDRAGMVMTRLGIPWIDESIWNFNISAYVSQGRSGTASQTLFLREETPGKPQMWADFSANSIKAGQNVRYSVTVRDAVNQPVAGLPVRVWIGPKGTTAPTEKEAWEKASTLVYTTPAGVVEGETQAPRTLAPGTTTSIHLVAKSEYEGHALDSNSQVVVGFPLSAAELFPEAGVVIPGIDQRMLLRVSDGYGKGVSANFVIEADGLKERVSTDAYGEAEVLWKTPIDLGAFRNVGPCAGGVAAAVVIKPEGDIPALGIRREPFELCVSVDRELNSMVRPDKMMAMPGESVRVRMLSAKGQPAGAWSLLLGAQSDYVNARGLWVSDGDKGSEISLPEGSTGLWDFSALSPDVRNKARAATGNLWVRPNVLPKITGKMVAGRAAPGGEVEIEAILSDGQGNPLLGKVAAVMIDRFGGGTVESLKSMDTRLTLCRMLRVEDERCDTLLEGGDAAEPARRAFLSRIRGAGLEPINDPGGSAREQIIKAFGEVLRSLEGAVFEATESAERLRDVRRKDSAGNWVFNPELMTLVTAAMSAAPETPGGETLALSDLVAVDPQVTFDNVARRVTRLKLFRVLMKVREFRHERRLDPEEPALKDPNAILRKLVRDGVIEPSLLLDPWGGTIQFMKAQSPPLPFLTAVRGFELRAPGPDRQVGNADDVKDPFERVVKSGTPYAMAVEEDRIVDAKVEMEVGDATISAWETMFNELTGTALGNGWGSGVGSGFGAGGIGEGIGLGGIGTIGHGRGSYGISVGGAVWTPPVRTDAQGKARIKLKLGDAETTWSVALLGIPDVARPAVSSLDIPVVLPLSARVDSGAAWVTGDEGDVVVTIRNRSAQPANTTVLANPSGSVVFADARQAKNEIIVPAGGSVKSRLRLKALRRGQAVLDIEVRAPSIASDKVTHRWEIKPQGEPVVLSMPKWVESQAELSLPVDSRVHQENGAPSVVIERGDEAAIRSALAALNPDGIVSVEALADSLETAARVEKWAVGRFGEESPLRSLSADIAKRASAKLRAVLQIASENGSVRPPPSWAAEQRLQIWAPIHSAEAKAGMQGRCPDRFGTSLEHALLGLEIEPPPINGVRLACWDAFVTEAVYTVRKSGDAASVARAVLALAERPHRVSLAANLAKQLRDMLSVSAGGEIALSYFQSADRAYRALVYAALVRSASLGAAWGGPNAAKLLAWLKIQVDAKGGYGSSVSTRAAVQAILAMAPASETKTVVTVTAGDFKKEAEIPLNEAVKIALPAHVKKATLLVSGAPVLTRYEQPMLRLWSRPPESAQSPVRFETTWPSKALAGGVAPLRVSLNSTSSDGSATVEARIPLPPGVSLAAPITGVRQIQGVISIRKNVGFSPHPILMDIPLRFGLSGKFTVPEARAKLAFEEAPFATAPARPLVVGIRTK